MDNLNIKSQCKNKVIILFSKHSVIGNCLIASVLLSELLNKHNLNNKIISGYWYNEKYYGKHFWIEIEETNEIIDISQELLSLVDKRFLKISRIANEPLNLCRIDNETIEEKNTLKELEEGFDIYNRKGLKNFTKSAPGYIRKFIRENL